jgi:hypothetical protein
MNVIFLLLQWLLSYEPKTAGAIENAGNWPIQDELKKKRLARSDRAAAVALC